MMKTLMKTMAAAAMGLAFLGVSAHAADHEVRMLNKGPDGKPMQFDPALLTVAPGDTVTFVNVDKGHNSEAIKGMIPEGAEPWKGKINEEIKVTFAVEGLYGYKCTPHAGMGMVGIVQVGKSVKNLEELRSVKLPGKAKAHMAEILSQVETNSSAAAQ
jgi:pseudoazurin